MKAWKLRSYIILIEFWGLIKNRATHCYIHYVILYITYFNDDDVARFFMRPNKSTSSNDTVSHRWSSNEVRISVIILIIL